MTGASNVPLLTRAATGFFVFGRHDKLKLPELCQIPQSRRAFFGEDILQSMAAEPMPTWRAHDGASNVPLPRTHTVLEIFYYGGHVGGQFGK